MLPVRKIKYIFLKAVFFVLIVSLNLAAQNINQSEIINVNAPETLLKISSAIKELESSRNPVLVKDIIGKTELICSKSIKDTSNYNFDSLLEQSGKINVPDNDLAVYSSINNEYMPEISFNELSFRLLTAIQKHQDYLLNNLSSTEKMASIPIYTTTNIDISKMKTLLVRRQIWILTTAEKKDEKLRCWLAIKRMLDEIDIPKSESGDPVVQRSPYGIVITSGEIINKLKILSDNELDDETRIYSGNIVKDIETAGPKYKPSLTEIGINELENFNPFKSTVNEYALEVFNKGLTSTAGTEKIKFYSKAIEIEPGFTAAYFNRGICYYENENFSSASIDFLKVLKLDQGYPSVYKYLGNCNYREEKFQEAVKYFTEALKNDISDTLFLCRGLCYQKMGQYKPAAADYSSAIKLNPKLVEAHKNRVKCYITLKRYDDAAKDYQRLIMLEPRNSNNYYNLGYIYSIRKDWVNVIEIWEKGLQVNPGDENILKNLPKAKLNLNKKVIRK
jgi:Flp pilus assembly protein TadD